MTAQDVLQQCTVDGNIVKLPNGQLERKLYQDVSKSLEKIGGKWKGGKTMGFVFPDDPTFLLDQVARGVKRNLVKEFQFFPTPDELADQLVSLADLNPDDIVLEPSAGRGSIISAIRRYGFDSYIFYVEMMEINRSIISKRFGAENNVFLMSVKNDDFLEMDNQNPAFTKIIANPPFSNNQDVDHVRHMYSLLKPNGRIVSIVVDNWDTADKKKKEFIQWLKDKDAEVIDVPSGAFKQSGTYVPTKIVIINKQ